MEWDGNNSWVETLKLSKIHREAEEEKSIWAPKNRNEEISGEQKDQRYPRNNGIRDY